MLRITFLLAIIVVISVIAEPQPTDNKGPLSSPTVASFELLSPFDIQLIPSDETDNNNNNNDADVNSNHRRNSVKPQFTLNIRAYGQIFSFLIERNDDLFTSNAQVLVHNQDGEVTSTYSPAHLSYKGVGGQENAIRVTILDAQNGILKGYFTDASEIYYVDPIDEHIETMNANVDSTSKVVVYRETDIREDPDNPIDCGVQDPITNSTEYYSYRKRQESTTDASTTYTFAQALPAFNCPTSQKTLTMSVAADHTYVARMQSLNQNPVNFIQTQFNTISGIYQITANVKIRLDEIVLFTAANNVSWNSATCGNISSKLYQFSEWRGTRNKNAGLWHLVTDCFRSGTVGLAWVGVLCQKGSTYQGNGQYVSGTGVSSYLTGQGSYRIPAHEIGHNFGAQHSAIGIMVPSSISSDQFQLESQKQICQGIYNSGSCLVNSCVPNCSGKTCGSNGCGGSCGNCTSPSTCSAYGTCQTCVRNCNNKTCGNDGCGGTCGTCGSYTTCSSGNCIANNTVYSQQWVDLHNQARSEYRIVNVTWSSADAAVAASWASNCTWGSSAYGPGGRGYRGENIAAYPAGSGVTPSTIFNQWLYEKYDWTCESNTCAGSCEHYTQIIWESSITIGCAIQSCPSGSPFGNNNPWTFVVCEYTGPGNQIGMVPFDTSKCSGECNPVTTCAAQGRACGTINDGCQTVDCGTCGADTTCNSQGQCVCKPAGTCSSAGRQCGSFYDGCQTLDCGSCSPGFNCSSSGICEANPSTCQPVTSCAAQNKLCGTVWNGCENELCGACSNGQSCIQGQCSNCTNCHTYAICMNSQCSCLSGYTGDGFYCTPSTAPVKSMGDWNVISGTYTGWHRAGSDMELSETTTTPNALRKLGTEAQFQLSSTTWRALVLRTSANSEPGLVVGEQDDMYWSVSIDATTVYLTSWVNSWKTQYVVASNQMYPMNKWIEIKVTVTDMSFLTISVDGAILTTFNLDGGSFSGNVGLYGISGTARYNETVFYTSSTLSITLVECLTQEQFAQKIATILDIPVTQVQSIGVSSNCNKRSSGLGNVYTFTLVGTPSVSSSALATQLKTKLYNNHLSFAANGITPLSPIQTILPVSKDVVTISSHVESASAARFSYRNMIGIVLTCIVAAVTLSQ